MERREHKRRRFWLPLEVEGIDGGMAVSHDASDNGLLLVCQSTLPVGARVRITLRIPPGGPVAVPVSATVVRISQNDDDPDGIWPYKMAVCFDEPVPHFEEYLAQVKSPLPVSS
jgi:PilZ domain